MKSHGGPSFADSDRPDAAGEFLFDVFAQDTTDRVDFVGHLCHDHKFRVVLLVVQAVPRAFVVLGGILPT